MRRADERVREGRECGEVRQAHPYADTPLAVIPAQRRAHRLFATDRTAHFSTLKN